MVTRSSLAHTLGLALLLAAAPLPASAQSAAPAQGRRAAEQNAPARSAERPAPAARSDSGGEAAAGDDGGVGFIGDAERAVAAFAGALRDVARPDTWTGASSPRTSGLHLLATPLGRLAAVLTLFGVTVWSLFNPRRALVIVAWVSGFALIPLAERTGKMWVGVGSTVLYWALLHYLLQRFEARRSRTRTAWGDG